MTRRAWLLFAAMSVIWGIPYLLIKVVMDAGLEPGFLVFGRTAIGALLLLPVAIRRGVIRPALARWRVVLAFAVIEIAVPWYLLNSAEERLSSSLVALLIAMVPLIGTVVAWRLGDRSVFSPVRLVGLAVGLGGVGAVVGLNLTDGGTPVWALGAVCVTCVGYAVAPMIADRKLSDVPSLGVVTLSLSAVALVYLPFGILQAPSHLPRANVLASIVALGVVCTALAFVCFFALIAEAGSVRATVITYVNPVVALLGGVAVLGESVTGGILVGFPVVLAGSYLATRATPATAQAAEAQGAATDATPDATPAASSPELTAAEGAGA
jgi:drug/metabolite transporter (DMT)-like permease